jgi:putative membrane protein insertion efficiency factor
MKNMFILIFFILICLSELYSDEREDLLFILHHNPVDQRIDQKADKKQASFITNEVILLAFGLYNFYKIFLSPQAPPSCNFIPSCSEYAIQSIHKYGILPGILLASDRLLRCNGLDMKGYTYDPETGRFYDPVERNIP